MDEDHYEESPRRFKVGLTITHPTLFPDAVTSGVGLEPTYVQPVGAQRRGGRGQPLEGFYKRTFWIHDRLYEAPDQRFAQQLAQLVKDLEPTRTFLENLRASGGTTSLDLKLLDDEYYGDALPAHFIAKIAELGLELGIVSYAVPQNVGGEVTKLSPGRRRVS